MPPDQIIGGTPDDCIAALKSCVAATDCDYLIVDFGRGELSKALTVHAHGFSKGAREAIEGAGGTCIVVDAGGRKKNRLYR